MAWGAVGGGGVFLEAADLVGHRGGELLAPASPGEGFVVEEEHGAGGVGLQALRFDVGLEVDDDAFVAEADAEVLQAPVSTAGLGDVVVELVAVDRDDVAAGGPGAGFAAAGAVVVVEHPPARDRVADLDDAAADGAALDVGALALDPGELSGLPRSWCSRTSTSISGGNCGKRLLR